MASISLQIEL